MTQHIRRSQFVITYGPGAILEGQNGPRIIPSAEIGLFPERGGLGIRPADYEISDQRMSEGILGGARIFRLPSNAELGLPESQKVYQTKRFPYWKLCLMMREHTGRFYVLYTGSSCPMCKKRGRGDQEAIRFIKACPDGHMDDFHWAGFAHFGHTGCTNTDWFKWYGGGGALKKITIQCPKCESKSKTMETAYQQPWKCTGRFPEREQLKSSPIWSECSRKAHIIQRQASNLRVPELRTLFSIPPRYTMLHNLMQLSPIFHNLVGSSPSNLKQLHEMLESLCRQNIVARGTVDEIKQYDWAEIKATIEEVIRPVSDSYQNLITDEFKALIHASYNGSPPSYGPRPRSPILFEVNPSLALPYSGPNKTVFRVTPILRLRTVTVQKGYRREINTSRNEEDTSFDAQVVDVSFPDQFNPNQKWYPGVEFPGEGIFVTLEENNGWSFKLKGESTDSWKGALEDSASYNDYVFRDTIVRDELHPAFVWWHTLSHLLIREISAEAGYSSASIRERVYVERNESDYRAGILLYATQPGSEGTLGGLIALVPSFQKLIDGAFEQLDTCSGDPLCLDKKFGKGNHSGAACYACMLLSETSCEHRNMWLDRNVLLENLP